MKKWIITAATVLALMHASSAAACYGIKEFEAEQGLRIHSELMVIGLTCIKMPQGNVLYDKYQRFTTKNAPLISAYENVLIGYFHSRGARNPEQKLHTLRTNLANEISQNAIGMSTSTFCQKFAPNVDQALQMNSAKLRRWAQHRRPGQPTSEPVCASITE